MSGSDITALVREARQRTMTGEIGPLLERLDAAIAGPLDAADRGSLLLARAVAMQGEDDPSGPARDAAEAARLLQAAGRPNEAAYAAAGAAVFAQRAGQHEEAVNHAVASMVLQSQSTEVDPEWVRSANGLGILFGQLSAFEMAVRSGTEAFAASALDHVTREITAYTLCFLVVESLHGEIAVDAEPAIEAARWLSESGETTAARTVLGPGMLAELTLLDRHDADVQAIAAAIEPRLDELVPRLRAWAQLVLGSIARRFGELTVAVAHLDAALPVLIGIGDEHRIVRAYSERAEAKAALGDTAGAFVDARACTRYVRRNQLDLVGQLSVQIRQRADLEIARAALRRRADDLAQEAAVDALTGVGSRRWMERLLDRLGSQGGQGAVVLVDLDHFKSVNDRFGHHAGDLTLQAVGRILRDSVRDGDHVARLGGEEFVIIAPGTPAEVATQLAERIRTEIEAAPWHEIDPELRVTASAGVAHGPLASVREVIRVADAALYDAKRAGRNRVAAA